MGNFNFEQLEKEFLFSDIKKLKEIKEILIKKNETEVNDLGKKPLNQIADILTNDSHCEYDGGSDGCCVMGDDYRIHHSNPEHSSIYENYIVSIYFDEDCTAVSIEYLSDLIEYLERKKEIPNVILNFTPHEINIIGQEPIISSGIARVTENVSITDTLNGIDIITKGLGEVTGLPEPEKNTFIIVSLMVAQALPERKDLLIPGELVRDDKGVIQGCKNLCRL